MRREFPEFPLKQNQQNFMENSNFANRLSPTERKFPNNNYHNENYRRMTKSPIREVLHQQRQQFSNFERNPRENLFHDPKYLRSPQNYNMENKNNVNFIFKS